jgi:heme/copper-type cytochrome/quinol oxidase subunit 4
MPMDRKKLNAIVGYVSRSLSAAALMIWGVFNMSVLAIQYMRRTGDDGNWLIACIMCGLFGALPFILGSWLLFRNISAVNKQPKS